MFSRSYFDGEGEVGEVVGKIASVSLYVLDLECVLLEGEIFSNVDWLGLLYAFYISACKKVEHS